jgi:hypothetical protein
VCLLTDIDATGKFGDQLTQKLNKQETLQLTRSEILSLLNEDGQVLELDILIHSPKNFEIIVRNGYHVDILGNAELSPEVIGRHSNGNLEYYLLDSRDSKINQSISLHCSSVIGQ